MIRRIFRSPQSEGMECIGQIIKLSKRELFSSNFAIAAIKSNPQELITALYARGVF